MSALHFHPNILYYSIENMNSKRLPILFLFILFSFGLNAQTPNYDSTFTALFKTEDDSARAEKLFFLFDDMYLYEPEATAEKYLPTAQKMLDEARKNQHPFGIAKANHALAYLYKRIRRYDIAFKYSALAEAEWRKTHNYKGLAELMFLKAGMMVGNNDKKEIIVLCEEAISICKKYEYNKLFVDIAGFLATQHSRMGQFDKAIALGNDILKTPGIKKMRKAYTYNDMGISLKLAGRINEARIAYDSALKITKEINAPIGANLGNCAGLELVANNLDLALKLAEQAEKELESEGSLESSYNNYQLLSEICSKKKDFEKALKYSKLAFKLNDTLNTLERQSEYMALEKKFQAGQKDKTIAEQKAELAEKEKKQQFLWFSIAGILLVGMLMGFLFYTNRKRKELKLNQNIAESEMKALRAQMNPHFMFNSLNAIQQMVMNNENENAFRYLDTYSKLTRQILENSEKKWITVKDEMKFLELYLEIESLRFEHAFRYKIEASDEVMPNSDRIPAMVVQPIVENAIKHGLLRKDGDKNLLIRFDRKDDKSPLEVVVEDNGLGRAATLPEKKESDHHSMSLGITENRLQLLDATGGSRMEVEDLHSPDGKAAGTRVHIYISQNA